MEQGMWDGIPWNIKVAINGIQAVGSHVDGFLWKMDAFESVIRKSHCASFFHFRNCCFCVSYAFLLFLSNPFHEEVNSNDDTEEKSAGEEDETGQAVISAVQHHSFGL
jgi:hypothetical protein